jgi:DNA-directed RNA polymerase subunit alpha
VIQKNWQELIKPNKLTIEPGDDPTRVAKIIAEPLERGFGMTVGNALRRVLLSSLQGAAVTAISSRTCCTNSRRFPGVGKTSPTSISTSRHRCCAFMPRARSGSSLRKVGIPAWSRGDDRGGRDIEIMNPDIVLCTLDEGAVFNCEFTVDSGKGYVPAAMNRPEDCPIGLIPVDAIFSPSEGRLRGGQHPLGQSPTTTSW